MSKKKSVPSAVADGSVDQAAVEDPQPIRACSHNPTAQPPECGFCYAPAEVINGTSKGPQVIASPASEFTPAPGQPQMYSIVDVMRIAQEMARSIVEGMRAPTEEERLLKERKRNERNRLIEEQRESRERDEELKRNCPHMRADANGGSHSTIAAVHNYPDGLPRGICQMCGFWIKPNDPLYDRVIALHNSAMQAVIA